MGNCQKMAILKKFLRIKGQKRAPSDKTTMPLPIGRGIQRFLSFSHPGEGHAAVFDTKI